MAKNKDMIIRVESVRKIAKSYNIQVSSEFINSFNDFVEGVLVSIILSLPPNKKRLTPKYIERFRRVFESVEKKLSKEKIEK